MKKTIQSIITGLTAFTLFAVLQTTSAHAASITVATGNDENTDNASCSLSEAIENINDQAATNTDCPAGDGVNDTINIPAGTITLVADLASLTEPTTVKGVGMGGSIIDADSQYLGLSSSIGDNQTFTVSDLTIAKLSGAGVASATGKIIVQRVEVDGNNATANNNVGPLIAGILSVRVSDAGRTVDTIIVDSNIHDVSGSDGGAGVYGVAFIINGGAEADFTIDRTTIFNIDSSDSNGYGIGYVGGFFGLDHTPNTLTGNISNVTISEVSGVDSGVSAGVIVNSATEDGEATTVINIDNSTIKGVRSGRTGTFDGSGLAIAGAAVNSSSTATTTINAKNLLMADNKKLDGDLSNCQTFDSSSFIGGSGGTINNTFISSGGNVVDDTDCSSYFTHTQDQNNLTNLGSTIGPLQNNGGMVPTMALLEGSPAIDSGVTVADLAQDARGSVRPQGLAYDSGAYESPFTTAVITSSANETLANTGAPQLVYFIAGLVAVAFALIARIRLEGKQ